MSAQHPGIPTDDVGELMARFAHDLRSPVLNLQMYAQTLAEHMPNLLSAQERCRARGESDVLVPDAYRKILPRTPEEILAVAQRLEEVVDRYRREIERAAAGPAVNGHAQPTPPPPRSAPRSAPGRPETGRSVTLDAARVLLVDDDLSSRELTSVMLDWMGCEVVAAGDGGAALEMLARDRFSLVLMDCRMPGTDGWTATRRLRALEGPQARRTPVIGLTTSPTDKDREKGLAAGMDDFLVKPITEERVSELLQRYVADTAV